MQLTKEQKLDLTKVNNDVYGQRLKQWAWNSAANFHIINQVGLQLGITDKIFEDTETPCIVCAPGMALHEALADSDKRAKIERHYVVSCMSALPVLLAHGIRPFVTVAYDAGKELADYVRNVDTRKLMLVAMTSIHPVLVNAWNGPMLFFNQYHNGYEFLEKVLPAIYPQFSCYNNAACTGNMAVVLAAHTFCFNPVYMLGLEYPLDNSNSYTPSRYGCDKHGEWHQFESERKEIPPEYIEAHRRYKQTLVLWAKKFKFPVVNCSPLASFKDELPYKELAEI